MMRISGPNVAIAGLTLLLLTGCQQISESRVAVEYYSITGNSTKALDRQIRQKGPRISGGQHAVAVARIRMLPVLTFQPRNGGCEIADTRVNVDAKVTLPRWTGRGTANTKMGEAWDNIDRYTRAHEAVHVAIAFRYARLMEADLKRMTSRGSCATLRARAQAVIDRYLAEHDKSQRSFDADEQKRLQRFSRQAGS